MNNLKIATLKERKNFTIKSKIDLLKHLIRSDKLKRHTPFTNRYCNLMNKIEKLLKQYEKELEEEGGKNDKR